MARWCCALVLLIATASFAQSVGLAGDFMAAFVGKGAPAASLERLIERMERQEFDLIAVGRALLSDPQWAQKVRAGQADQFVRAVDDPVGEIMAAFACAAQVDGFTRRGGLAAFFFGFFFLIQESGVLHGGEHHVHARDGGIGVGFGR